MPPTILAFDPGARNFAYAVLGGIDVVASGWVTPLSDVGQPTPFLASALAILDRYSTDYVVAERFQFRGACSTHAEEINQALGYLGAICLTRGRELRLVTPSTWKRWRDAQGLADAYADLPSIHLQDAAGIGRWFHESAGLAQTSEVVRASTDEGRSDQARRQHQADADENDTRDNGPV